MPKGHKKQLQGLLAEKERSLIRALVKAREATPTQEEQWALMEAPEKDQKVQGASRNKLEGQRPPRKNP